MTTRGRAGLLAGLCAVASLASCGPAEPPPSEQPASVMQAVGAVQSPALHLPPGRWRLQVLVTGSLAPGCDRGGRSLMIELDPIDLVIR